MRIFALKVFNYSRRVYRTWIIRIVTNSILPLFFKFCFNLFPFCSSPYQNLKYDLNWCLTDLLSQVSSRLRGRNLKRNVLLWKRTQRFPSTLCQRNLKTQQSSVLLDLCLRNWLGQVNELIILVTPSFLKSCVFYMWIRPYKNEMSVFSNSFRLKIVFKKLLFRNVVRSHENFKHWTSIEATIEPK